MSLLKFLKSRVFWLQVGIALVAIAFLLWLTLEILGHYTTSGRTVVVPQLVGQLQADVEEEVHNADMSLKLIDSLYRADTKPGAIVDQIPAAGKKVKKGRIIYITINAFSKEMTTMPALVNFSFRNARVNLQNAGLELGKVDSIPSPYDGLVLKQLYDGKPIDAGQKLPKGSKVNLVVGCGASDGPTTIPSLITQSYEDAISAIAAARLSLGNIDFDETIRSAADTSRAIVYRQSPAASSGHVEAWSTVNLWLTTDMTKLSNAILADDVEEDYDL